MICYCFVIKWIDIDNMIWLVIHYTLLLGIYFDLFYNIIRFTELSIIKGNVVIQNNLVIKNKGQPYKYGEMDTTAEEYLF